LYFLSSDINRMASLSLYEEAVSSEGCQESRVHSGFLQKRELTCRGTFRD
jgi:hypothetical protein